MVQYASTLNRRSLPLDQILWQISKFGGRLISFLIDASATIVILMVVLFLLLVDFSSTAHAVFVRGVTEQSAVAAAMMYSKGFWGLFEYVMMNVVFNLALLVTTAGWTWKILGAIGENLLRMFEVRFSESEKKLSDLGFETIRLETRLSLIFFGLWTIIEQVTLVVNSNQIQELVEDLPRILSR